MNKITANFELIVCKNCTRLLRDVAGRNAEGMEMHIQNSVKHTAASA